MSLEPDIVGQEEKRGAHKSIPTPCDQSHGRISVPDQGGLLKKKKKNIK